MRGLVTLLKSAIAGGAATLADLGSLALMVQVLGVSPRVASVPALLCGATVNFFGNRHFAFRAGGGSARAQLIGYAAVFAVTLVLNAGLFDLGMRALGARGHDDLYWVLRLGVSNAVYLAWSFPMFKRVFRAPAAGGSA